MNAPPQLELTPRAKRELVECLDFIASQPWGKPADRKLDFIIAMAKICEAPLRHPVKVLRPATGRELRCYRAAQFVIIYSYVEPNATWPTGKVSIRAIRHRRVQDVFFGVREPAVPYGVSAAA